MVRFVVKVLRFAILVWPVVICVSRSLSVTAIVNKAD